MSVAGLEMDDSARGMVSSSGNLTDCCLENRAIEVEAPNDEEHITRLLIAAYVSEQLAELTYHFVLIFFLSSVLKDSLLLVSIYGLNAALISFIGLGKAGSFLDSQKVKNRRFQSILVVMVGQYSCIVACCAICYALLKLLDDDGSTAGNSLGGSTGILLFLVIFLSGLSKLFSEASDVSIEKDWLVVITGNNTNYLGTLNAKLRRVHLVCKMMGPGIIGHYLDGTNNELEATILIIGVGNIFSFIVKCKCLKCICAMVPALMIQSGTDFYSNSGDEEGNIAEQTQLDEYEDDETKHCSCSLFRGYVIYFQQDISMGGVGFSLLWLNVMTPTGDIMTSYLIWRGISLSWIGFVRGAATVTALLGTILFGWSTNKYPLRITATASIAFMAACLTVSFSGTLFVSNDKVSLFMLMIGIIISRIGLWVNDLAICQLAQQTVDENVRGIVGGSQHSLENFLYALQFVCGLIWADPSQFYILCTIGYSAVVGAFFLILRGVYLSAAFHNITPQR